MRRRPAAKGDPSATGGTGVTVPVTGAKWPYRRPRPQISVTEGVSLVTTLIWPTFVLFFPAFLAATAREDTWWVAGAGGIVALLVALVLSGAAGRLPHLSLVDQAQLALGKWLGKALAILFCAGVTFLGVYAVRAGTDMVGLLMLPRTPPWAIILVIVGQGAIGAYYGLEVVTRTALVAFLSVGVVMLVILPGLLMNFDARLLQPVLSYGGKPLVFPLLATGGFWAQVTVMGLCSQSFARPGYLRGAGLLGGVAAVLTGWLLVIVTQGAAGWYATSRHTLPLVEAIRSVRMFVPLLERVDVLVVIGWTMMGFAQVAYLLWAGSLGWARTLGLLDFRPLLPFLAVGVAVLALTFPRDTPVLIDVWSGHLVPAVGWGLFALATLVWVVAAVRGMKEEDGN